MVSDRKLATVFGGSGFLGRYVVQRLAAQGYIVRIGVRDPESAKILQPMGDVGQIVPLGAPVTDEAAVARAVEGAELVINLTGILAERHKGEFFRTHVDGAGRIAHLARLAGARQLIHISAIGADAASASQYGQSKAQGEAAVRGAFPRAVILRPSIMFGPEDNFFNRFAGLARFLPVLPIVHGTTKFQPVYVGDVADAVIATINGHAGQTFELGGPEVKSFAELLTMMLEIIGRPRKIWDMPLGLARLQANILERLPGKLLTNDQINMLAYNNVVATGAPGLEQLGISPTRMEQILPLYLARYREGGKGQETAFQE